MLLHALSQKKEHTKALNRCVNKSSTSLHAAFCTCCNFIFSFLLQPVVIIDGRNFAILRRLGIKIMLMVMVICEMKIKKYKSKRNINFLATVEWQGL